MTETPQQPTKKTKGKPDEIDIRAGKRLRVRRSLLGLSQAHLAEQVGLSFQQIQKYERGDNRMSAGRLVQFGKVLEVPPSYFLDDSATDEDVAGSGAQMHVLFAKRSGGTLASKLTRLHEHDPSCIDIVHGMLNTLLRGIPRN